LLIPEFEVQVAAGHLLFRLHQTNLQARQLQSRGRRSVLEVEDHAEERRAAAHAVAVVLLAGEEFFEQPREGQLLMLVGGQRRVARTGQQVSAARLFREPQAEQREVDEAPDQALGRRQSPPRQRDADDEISPALARVQEGGERGDARHEQRHALARAEIPDRLRSPLVEVQGQARGARSPPRGGPREVGLKLGQRRRVV
jgi:hypothetical protein